VGLTIHCSSNLCQTDILLSNVFMGNHPEEAVVVVVVVFGGGGGGL
jgi:hypothetical protein